MGSVIEEGEDKLSLPGGDYKMENLCLEPTSITVKEESPSGAEEFVKTKLMTRLTYTLDQISGDVKLSGSALEFQRGTASTTPRRRSSSRVASACRSCSRSRS